MLLRDKGDPKTSIWVIIDAPYPQDAEKGFLFSSSYGWFFEKIWRDSGIKCDYFVYSQQPDLETPNAYRNLQDDINYYKPTFIIPLGDICCKLCPQTARKTKKNGTTNGASMDKWSGSLLTSSAIKHPHYIIPTYPPDFTMANYGYRDIQVSIDLGHVREEVEFWQKNGFLNPLPLRNLIVPKSGTEVIEFLRYCKQFNLLSSDIETIRPMQKKSQYREHCGLPYTNAFAYDPFNAMSYSFWDYTEDERVIIWKETDWLLTNIPQIGQNYFSFDSHYYEQLGFTVCLDCCHDTMLRHHILWPECEHKLQFLTKQYTREPYYKDDGKQWNPKFKDKLQRYNCLDVCVTYEVFLRQEEEFQKRQHLKG